MSQHTPSLVVERVAVDDLKPWALNPRKNHAVDAIAKSIEAFGYLAPIIVQKGTRRVLAGHGRLDALKAKHFTHVDVVVADITDQQAALYTIADNKLTERAEWDTGLLARVVADLERAAAPLELTAFDPAELEALVRPPSNPAPDPGDVPDLPAAAVTERGDLWQLGEHRVFCGDSFDEQSITTLNLIAPGAVQAMITDPPYAIYGSSTGIAADITDDKMVRPFFEQVLRLAARLLPWFGHAYLCCDWRSWAAIWEAARSAGMVAKNLIVWDKGGQGLGSNYANTYELVGFFAKLPPQKVMGDRIAGQRVVHRPNLQRFDRPRGEEREHNAAKPIGLMAEFVQNSTDKGDAVLEPFCGSGTTLIACEQLGRRCFAVDIEPRYVDVTVRRWQRVTGAKAVNLSRPGVTLQA